MRKIRAERSQGRKQKQIYEAAKRDQKSRHEEHINHGAKYALPHGNFHPTESRVHGAVDPAHVCARTEDISMWEGRAAEWKGVRKRYDEAGSRAKEKGYDATKENVN